MENIKLDQRDRRNIYKEDAENVFAAVVHADDDDPDISNLFANAAEHVLGTGSRWVRAYIVVRVER